MAKGSTLGKNPSVNWFFNDWHGGTSIFSRHQKGCYMDILHAQFNNGHLSLDEIKNVLGSDFGQHWPTIRKKFKEDKDGLFYNERLESETLKKSIYSESQSEKRKGKKNTKSVKTPDNPGGYGNGLGHGNSSFEMGSGEKLSNWFDQLKISTILLETLGMNNKVHISKVLEGLEAFRPKAGLSYESYKNFVYHFKNWFPEWLKLEANGKVDKADAILSAHQRQEQELREKYKHEFGNKG